MNIRKLTHVVVLARYLNFTRASRALGITQSALSRSIQTLEDECNLKLFDRTRNLVAVTAVGREFLRHAESVLRKDVELRDFVSHSARGDGGSIAIGMAPLASRLLLSPIMADMIDKPGFHADVTIGSSKKLLSMLVEESLQLCVCTGQELSGTRSDPLMESVQLARFPLALVVRTGHPLSSSASAKRSDLDAYPLLRSRPFDLDDETARGVANLPMNRPALSVEDYETLLNTTMSTDAVWVTSSLSAKKWLDEGSLIQLPISWLANTPQATMTAYRLKGRTMSPTAGKVWTQILAMGPTLHVET